MIKVVMLKRELKVRGGNIRFKFTPIASVCEDQAQKLLDALNTYQPVQEGSEYSISDLQHWDDAGDYIASIQSQLDVKQEEVKQKALKKLSPAERKAIGLLEEDWVDSQLEVVNA